ncbi:uncharacterized protein LOC128559271 [Mercenaria mercenaria]|uniref:uncharacterized protein LOC128559271 n=1 Tax=Mercenaria mercenaria TaxID=6596 RepID=UPI00234E6E4D|nr:uncharacterized protein LOC128559271 [Mercenaria mercenaria]
MSYKRAILNLVFGFVFHLRFQCCHSNTNEVFDNLRYNTGVVSWVQATRQCRDSITTLVHFNPDPSKNHHNISVVKRSVHFHYDNESWVGDYTTFEVISAQGVKPNINMHHCVAMHVTLEKVLPNNTLLYEYDLVTQNCSSNIFAVCTGKSLSTY